MRLPSLVLLLFQLTLALPTSALIYKSPVSAGEALVPIKGRKWPIFDDRDGFRPKSVRGGTIKERDKWPIVDPRDRVATIKKRDESEDGFVLYKEGDKNEFVPIKKRDKWPFVPDGGFGDTLLPIKKRDKGSKWPPRSVRDMTVEERDKWPIIDPRDGDGFVPIKEGEKGNKLNDVAPRDGLVPIKERDGDIIWVSDDVEEFVPI